VQTIAIDCSWTLYGGSRRDFDGGAKLIALQNRATRPEDFFFFFAI